MDEKKRIEIKISRLEFELTKLYRYLGKDKKRRKQETKEATEAMIEYKRRRIIQLKKSLIINK